MTPLERARQAYAPAHSPLRTARSSEHQILADVTARLVSAVRPSLDFAALAQALHDNRRLWIRFAADVSEDGNGLPDALRAQIFYLAQFTDQQSRKILRGEAGPESLIEINTAVMRGLSGQTGRGETN